MPTSPTATFTTTEGHRHAAVETVCAGVASDCPRSGQLPAHGERAFAHEKGLFGPNADAAHDKSGLPDKKELQRKRAASRVSPELFWGSAIFRPAWPASILRVGSEILV